ncbi:deaminase domain-containing protein [Chroococcus sp. FPU101]|uniref:deaminase domain-containing protein n=1 Tax=Chroococcus sp. FPU101 TaxID=1974212 RepID=UPI001A8F5A29|nr:deaminase domain-containing protein [Chroococcus sp. FPU101]GFE68617.1 hypothetical protein CFPU101_12270 [Chroococcus sp. FPU101]
MDFKDSLSVPILRNAYKQHLRKKAISVRENYLKLPFPKANVAVIELYLKDKNDVIEVGATSRAKSPSPIPLAKSMGGQFEPIVDSYSGRLMDTDAEYKALSAIADTLDNFYSRSVEGTLCLYTERQPCESCLGVIEQFKEKFHNIEIEVFWDEPYPP